MLKTALRSGLILLAMISTGCVCKTQTFEVSIKLDDSLKDPQSNIFPDVHVTLVGVTDGDELARYKAQAVEGWFSGSNDLRQGEIADGRLKDIAFGPGLPNPQSLAADDPVWEKWKDHKAMNMVIFASLPGKEGATPTEDPRRFVLTLSDCRWDNPDKIKIVVRASGMEVDPQPKPEK